MRLALLLPCVLLLGNTVSQENTQGPSYVVVFEYKQGQGSDPTVRINCVVAANTEGGCRREGL